MTYRISVSDVPCPTCKVRAGLRCEQYGVLVAFVDGPSFHAGRWEKSLQKAMGVKAA